MFSVHNTKGLSRHEEYEMFKSTGLLSACTTRSLDESLASNTDGRIKCVSLNNQPCQARSRLVNINSNELLYYPFIVSVNKCGESSNALSNPYARVCVPDKVENIN